MIDQAVRAALTADLAAVGRLVEERDAIRIDPAPVGWEPLDVALRHLLDDGRTLDDWIRTGPLGLSDVVDALVDAGVWRRRSRWFRRRARYDPGRPRDRWGRTPERRLVHGFAGVPGSPADAAVLALAWAAGVGDPQRSVDEVLDRTQGIRWMCESAQLISTERARNLQAARAMRLGGTIGAPG
ncbi:GPP34 family phosphoprotein [Blastococcus sp. SYSU DS0539]